jgi:uncharacterized protein (DUF697 family)
MPEDINLNKVETTQNKLKENQIINKLDAEKDKEAFSTIKLCTGIAAGIALVPLPVGDSICIIITQLIMIHSLCKKNNRTMGLTVILIVLSAMIGPIVFTALCELLPVFGSIIGAFVGGVFTYYIGQIVYKLIKENKEFSIKNFIGFFSKNKP